MAKEPETPEQQVDRMLADYDRTFRTWRGHVYNHHAVVVVLYYAAGLLGGVLLALGLAVAGRGGLVVVSLLQLAGLLLPGLSLALFLVSLVARKWGRRAAGRVLGIWIACLLALVVLKVAATFIDSGMRDVL